MNFISKILKIFDAKDPHGRTDFDKLYKGGDPWDVGRDNYRLKLASSFLTGKEHRILDVGCGYGNIFDYCPRKMNLYGVDISGVAIGLARKQRPYGTFKVADIQALPFKKGLFDFIFCLEVLYYLKDDTKAFMEINRVMGDNGKLLVGLTLGAPYYDYKEVMKKINKQFIVLNESFIFPKPFPRFLNKWARIGLLFYKILPFGAKLKVYVLLKKRIKR